MSATESTYQHTPAGIYAPPDQRHEQYAREHNALRRAVAELTVAADGGPWSDIPEQVVAQIVTRYGKRLGVAA